MNPMKDKYIPPKWVPLSRLWYLQYPIYDRTRNNYQFAFMLIILTEITVYILGLLTIILVSTR